MNLELSLLETFGAAAEELHFARAAERVHLDPSGVSRHVRQLEARLGTELFSRSTRNVELTDAGSVLLPLARTTIESATRFEAAARTFARVQRRELRVGLIAHAAGQRVLAALARVADQLQLDLVTEEVGFADTSAGVRDGSWDLGIVFEPIEPAGLQIHPLYELPRLAIVSADHRLAGRSAVHLADIVDEAWVEPATDDAVFHDYWMALAERTTTAAPRGPVVHTAEAGLMAVLGGRAVSIGATARSGFHVDGLVTVPIVDLSPCQVSVVVSADAPRLVEAAVRALADEIART